MPHNVHVIGSGFAGLSAAAHLSKLGKKVSIFEKNSTIGGRARCFEEKDFLFDMGPSWYWMPDVFETFFAHFGKKPSDYYQLSRLDPSYRIFYSETEILDIPASFDALLALFEDIEKGSAQKLKQFLHEAQYKYEVGINKLVYKPSKSLLEFVDLDLIKGLFSLHVFQSMHKYVRKYFHDPRLIQLMEFPVLFLGAMPKDTPALYSLMNYADIVLGTWYPKGGMNAVAKGMAELAESLGVEIHTNEEVSKLEIHKGRVKGITTTKGNYATDAIVAGADYHHVEQHILPVEYRKYSEKYWDSRTMAPSSLIFYLGIDKKVDALLHHNLFFDTDFEKHALEIYKQPSWPTDPLFYVCCPSKTDPDVAPKGKENLFILIPTAPNLNDTEEIREKLFDLVIKRLEKLTKQKIKDSICVKKSYAHKNFIEDYHSFKGNAYGLANTLLQTAILKPSMRNNKLKNLFFTGQLTVPGPGVPPSLISGEVVAKQLVKHL